MSCSHGELEESCLICRAWHTQAQAATRQWEEEFYRFQKDAEDDLKPESEACNEDYQLES